MNAGDALWYLYAELTMLERRCSADPLMLELIAKMRENVNVVGELIKVPPPPADKMQALIEYISTNVLTSAGVPDQSHEKAPPPKNDKFSDPERIEAARTVLSEMVASERFEWAAMIEDMHQRVWKICQSGGVVKIEMGHKNVPYILYAKAQPDHLHCRGLTPVKVSVN